AFTTWPKVPVPKSPFTAAGPKNCAWLKVLNVSKRNCRALVSVIRNERSSAISTFSAPGPESPRHDDEPGEPGARSVKSELVKRGHEGVPQIPSGKRARAAIVKGIDDIGNARSLIDGFAVCVSQHQVQSPAGVADTRFERIIVGVAEAALIAVVGEVRAQGSA